MLGSDVDSSNSVVGLGTNGQLIIQNVDAFKVRLLVKILMEICAIRQLMNI